MQKRFLFHLNELFRLYGTLDPFLLSESMNIEIRFVPFSEKPYGETVHILGDTLILISEDLKYSVERYFVCAHELFHVMNHDGLSSYYASSKVPRSKLELEANTFATMLLANLYGLNNGRLPETFDDVRREYGVPESMRDYSGN